MGFPRRLPKNQVVVLDCAAAPRVQLYVGNRCLKPRCRPEGRPSHDLRKSAASGMQGRYEAAVVTRQRAIDEAPPQPFVKLQRTHHK
jgi:hypothetical protein